MKLGPVTKFDKRNKTTLKTFDDDIMSENCDNIVIFSIYGQFGAVWKTDSRCIVYNTYLVCKTFILQKLKTKLQNTKNTTLTLLLCEKVLF